MSDKPVDHAALVPALKDIPDGTISTLEGEADKSAHAHLLGMVLERRQVLRGLAGIFAAPLLTPLMPKPAEAQSNRPPEPTDPRLDVWTRNSPKPRLLTYGGTEPVGSLMVDLQRKKLYFVKEQGRVVEYTIASPKPGMEPRGNKYKIYQIATWPTWTPPESVLNHVPGLRASLAARGTRAISGGEHNPMGAAALYMQNEQGVDEGYRIHGTNDPDSIGTGASIGCIRLHNLDFRAAPNGYIDHPYPLYDMVDKLNKAVSLTVYRNGQLIPGIGAPVASNDLRP